MIGKFARGLLLAALVMSGLGGCVPLMIGGYVGYQMAQKDAHETWCAQHAGDPSCHP